MSSHLHHEYYEDDDGSAGGYGWRSPLATLIARLVTMASLIVSVALLKTNSVTLDGGYVLTYNDFRSYKYMFYVMVIGIGYSLLQIPFAVYYMAKKKHLITSLAFLYFVFYADKVMAFVLATGVGAAFGATLDMKKYTTDSASKIQDFLTMSYIPAAFLLVGCIAALTSSLHSSIALSRKH